MLKEKRKKKLKIITNKEIKNHIQKTNKKISHVRKKFKKKKEIYLKRKYKKRNLKKETFSFLSRLYYIDK